MRPLGTGLLLAFALITTAACTGGDSDALGGFDGQEEDFHAVAMESIEDPHDLRERALERLDDDSPARVGAIFALTITAEPGPSMDALRGLLDTDELTERLMAADALATRGDQAGLPVLIAALDSDEMLGWPDPPQPVWSFVRFALLASTDQDLGLQDAEDLEAAATAKPQWEAWFADSGPGLRFDEAERKFRS